MQATLEQNGKKVTAMESETQIYKENAQKYMEQFNKVSQEYYEFRQNNIQADTRLRDMKIELQVEKEMSRTLQTELTALQRTCLEQASQIEKMTQRGLFLDKSIKSATENVHLYEKEVMRLERVLEKEKTRYE